MADLLQGVKDGLADGSADGPPDFKMPSMEELVAAIESMSELSEEQKKELLESVRGGQKGGMPGLGAVPPQDLGVSLELVWVLSLLSLVLLVLVFFGYKLYKSLVDRERRREEKKRQKLQKKKK